jgi:hypothetical protein
MGLFDAEPLDLKSENMGSMPTAVGIGQGAEIARRCGHGDNPGLRVPGVVDNADIVCDALGREGDIFEIVDAGQGEFAGRLRPRSKPRREIAFRPEPVIPPCVATPRDHVRGSVEAIGQQDNGLVLGQPPRNRVEQLFLSA